MPDQHQLIPDSSGVQWVKQGHGYVPRKHVPMSHLYSECKIRAVPITCRSVWCERCRKRSPTNLNIQNKLRHLDWKRTRHVILSLSRLWPADKCFQKIRDASALWYFTNDLKHKLRESIKYLWVLEFHADGYAHWHMLIERETEGVMIGKTIIEKLWPFGLVWETYPKSLDHWKAITGYHQKKGYLASETKAHQLTLPEYLKLRSRTRKFGTNIHDQHTIETTQTRVIEQDSLKRRTDERRQRTTAEAISDCCQQTYVEIQGMNGLHSFTTKIPFKEVEEILLTFNCDRNDPYNFNASRRSAIDFYTFVQKIDSKRKAHPEVVENQAVAMPLSPHVTELLSSQEVL